MIIHTYLTKRNPAVYTSNNLCECF